MEILKNFRKLTPEERKMQVRKEMYIELRAMEMERRQRVALEATEKSKVDRQEKQKDTGSWGNLKEQEVQERRAKEQKALTNIEHHQQKREKLQWEEVMMVDELLKRPRYREETELCCVPKVSPESLTSDLKAKEQSRKTTLYNNWVGEQKVDSVPIKEKPHPNSPTHLLSAAKPEPKPEVKIPSLLFSAKPGAKPERKTPTHLFAAKPGPKPERKISTFLFAVKPRPKPEKKTPSLLFTAKPRPKPERKVQSPNPKETPENLQGRLKAGYWVDKFQDYREKKDEKRKLKAEEQHAKFLSSKDGRASQRSRQHDGYVEGFTMKRNSILKSIF